MRTAWPVLLVIAVAISSLEAVSSFAGWLTPGASSYYSTEHGAQIVPLCYWGAGIVMLLAGRLAWRKCIHIRYPVAIAAGSLLLLAPLDVGRSYGYETHLGQAGMAAVNLALFLYLYHDARKSEEGNGPQGTPEAE